jgi:aspartyl protease family protein
MMFAMLLLVIAALGGLLLYVVFGDSSLEAISGWPIAAIVIGALILLYLATHSGGRGESRVGRLPILIALLAVAGLAIEVLRANPPALLENLFVSARTDEDANPLQANAPASVRIRRRADGSFLVNAQVNGEALPLLIDSGSATVVLRQSDAEKAGIDIKNLAFDTPLKTANGMSYLASVRLKSVRIGPLSMGDVDALVAKPGTLNENLLGMSFLRRLESYEVTGDFATLRQ